MAGTLAQGTSVIPCLVIRNGKPLTDKGGTPYVGFDVVIDSRKAVYASTQKFKDINAQRKGMTVENHHCGKGVKHVMSIRGMYALGKPPFFDPARRGSGTPKRRGGKRSELDTIVRAFHNSKLCGAANHKLIGRRAALAHAWDRFIADNQGRWDKTTIARAKHLDYAMRTAIYEGHLDRGCSAYGACERNIVALSIRNRGRGACRAGQGCRFPMDYQGISSKVSQYNIWDEFLTQISGLASCFLRDDLRSEGSPQDMPRSSSETYYDKIGGMYEQNVGDVERILFGSDRDLREIFPKTNVASLKSVRHYYHAPAMGKCFPQYPRVEYMSGAVARKGKDFALIANTRIEVGKKVAGGYRFKEAKLALEHDRDVMTIVDSYPGFVVDGGKVSLRSSKKCSPYGIPGGCRFKSVKRYRRKPPWLRAGRSLAIHCTIDDRGEDCRGAVRKKPVTVGGTCDTQMRPVAGVR